MEIAYWLVAGLLAVFYLYAGGVKLVRSKERLAPMMGWVDTIPMPVVLGALGLVLPPLTGVAPVPAMVAAIGFAVLQVLAAVCTSPARRSRRPASTLP